jgi:hypothetical protein
MDAGRNDIGGWSAHNAPDRASARQIISMVEVLIPLGMLVYGLSSFLDPGFIPLPLMHPRHLHTPPGSLRQNSRRSRLFDA